MNEDRQNIRVFISSTWKDLEEERALVLEAVRYLQFQHIAMEYFGADPRESIDVCLEKVRGSNIYVGIVGHRYGKIVEETGKSYTQMEYEEAMRKGLPCLIYLRSDEFPIPPKFMEKDPKLITKLEEFKSVLKKRHTPSYFNDGNDLTIKVVVDLSKHAKGLDYEVLNRILEYVVVRFNRNLRRILEDDDFKFHYLQERLADLGLITTSGFTCPICGRLLEEPEMQYSFGMRHPVCADCIVYRTEKVKNSLREDHPELLNGIEKVKKEAEEYLKRRSQKENTT